MRVAFTLPIPPSTNRLWRVGRGRVYPSKKYEAWTKTVGQELMAQRARPVKGRVHVELMLTEKSRIDLDNSVKSTLDALKKFGIIEGDSKKHVRSILLLWEPSIKALNVTIEPCL